MKKLDPVVRSINCMIAATSRGGKARRRRKPVTNIAQTKNGRRIQVSPLARRLMIVVRKLTAPRRDEEIRKTIPSSHCVCPARNWFTICESANPASGE